MQDKSDARLLRDYATGGDEAAFRDLVSRHTDFVYSAALRQVNSPDVACDIAQNVLIDLARKSASLADRLPQDASLMGWLHRSTRYEALNHFRDEQRRIARERQAMEQLLTDNEAAPDWEAIRPILDEALDELGDDEREALLLRYFKGSDFRAVGENQGISDDAAQKRVSRALEKLREFLAKRGVTVGAGGLVAVISANSVQSAPAGLTAMISSAALLAGTAVTSTTLIATSTTIAMTALQKILVSVAIAAAIGAGIYEARQASRLRDEVQTLKAQQVPLNEQVAQLQEERDKATNIAAALSAENATLKKRPTEVVKLRGEMGRLRQEKTDIASKTPLSKITANPEMKKLIRDQQKTGMTYIYKGLTKKLNLSEEQSDKFNDLLADSVMENIDRITEVLHDGKTGDALNRVFNDQDAATEAKLATLIGLDGVAQYKEYSKDLISSLTSEQFKPMLTGDKAANEEKITQLAKDVTAETQAALAAAGLPPDYQAVPMLNFRNIASESLGDQSIAMLDGIFEKVSVKAADYLTAEDLKKFGEFRALAMKNNRGALSLNRTMMAPIAK